MVIFATTLYSENITREQLVVRGGIAYKIDSDRPFTGTYLGFKKNGQLTERNNYKNGKFHGSREGYLENGQLEWLENYKGGKYHGLQEYFYKNSQIRWRGNYDNGKKIGMVQTFRPTGQVLIAEYYATNKPPIYKYFDQNNQIIINGVLEYFFENGQLAGRANIRNEKREGPGKHSVKTANLKEEGPINKASGTAFMNTITKMAKFGKSHTLRMEKKTGYLRFLMNKAV